MARSRRILMTTDTAGGVWVYALELAGALAAHQVEVVLATMGTPPTPAQARDAARLRNVELIASDHPQEWMQPTWYEVDDAGAWLQALAARFAPDVVHLNGYAHAAVPFTAPVVVVAHACVCTWWRAVHNEDAPAAWNDYRHRVAAGLRAASVVVAPTAAMLRAVLAIHGVARPGRVIASGRDPARFAPARKEPFVLGAGRRWDPADGLDTLDACAPAVPWPIRVAGPTTPPGGPAAPSQLELLGVLEPDQLSGWMARAAIYALPARYAPFGLSVLEAALSGCALVLGDLSTLREVWGDAALYVDPDDAGALAATLRRLAADSDARATLSRRAHARALELTPARMAAAYRALYDEVAA